MTREQIFLVQNSFKKVAPIQAAAAALFYKRLFELDPSLQGMFCKDITKQGHELMAMLATAVQGLSDLDRLLPVVRDLGIRHRDYGVEPAHYETAGAALLWTLEQGLEGDFTEDVRQAWATVYQTLAMVMMAAANEKNTA